MFALVAFGALFGFVGLMIAVPAAAAVGVLVRFGHAAVTSTSDRSTTARANPSCSKRARPRADR
jgi:predicted PurR-regulated permease PerM